MEGHKELLERFLNIPVSCSDTLFEMFAALPRARYGKGEKPLQRFVYVPGTRKDRVLLVAHADTVWDENYVAPVKHEVAYDERGWFYSAVPDAGIGADDRAGCAVLWALRDSGHSLLIVDGEEHGKIGAAYIRKNLPRLFGELNRHRYMIQFDWAMTDICLYNHVNITPKFERYIEQQLGFFDYKVKGTCDLVILCRNICGVNLGVGYRQIHVPEERLVLADWEHTYQIVSEHLKKPQKRFPTSWKKRAKQAWHWAVAFPGKIIGKIGRIVKR